MILYIFIIVFLIMLSIGRLGKARPKTLLVMSLLFLWLLATVRALEIGNDTKTYFNLFQYIASTHDVSFYSTRYEKGFLILIKYFTYISNDFWMFLAIVNAYIYIAYYKFIDRFSANPLMSVAIFFLLGTWGQTLNVIRVQLAVASFIYAYFARREKKRLLCILFVVLAVSFQRISILYTIAFFIPPAYKKKAYIITTVGGLLAYGLLPRIMGIVVRFIPYFNNYLNSQSYVLGEVKLASILGFLVRVLVFYFGFVVLIRSRRVQKGSNGDYDIEDDADYTYQVNMSYIAAIVMFVSLNFNLLDRCSYFFALFSIVMIPNAIDKMKISSNRLVTKLAILLFCVAYFLVINIYRPDWNHIYPYVTFLCKRIERIKH